MRAGVEANAISLGQYHTCTLSKDGRIFCWGQGANGQLGIGSQASVGTSAAQMGDNLKRVDLWAGTIETLLFKHHQAISQDGVPTAPELYLSCLSDLLSSELSMLLFLWCTEAASAKNKLSCL
jgi:alpha-tubulin suppressor-like RCC1 family protein